MTNGPWEPEFWHPEDDRVDELAKDARHLGHFEPGAG